MIHPFALYVDVTGTFYVTVKPLREEFFWLCLGAGYIPKLHLLSTANLRRMKYLGRVSLDKGIKLG